MTAHISSRQIEIASGIAPSRRRRATVDLDSSHAAAGLTHGRGPAGALDGVAVAPRGFL